jgi:HSP20 family protein
MQELKQALEEMKGLYQTVLGRPAPELGQPSFLPFPAGVDPVQLALLEVQRLKQVAKQVAFAPRPGAWVPLADSFVTDKEFVVRLEIPGVSREDLKIFVVGGECVIRGERKPPQCAGAMRPIALERPWGPFERRFVLPVGSRIDEVKARALEGVLEVRIPVEGIDVPKEQKIDVS